MSNSQNLASLSDEDLIARVQEELAHQPTADLEPFFTVLFERHWSTVHGWCLRVCGDPDRAQDAAQEVFLRLQTRLGSFRGDSRFSTWLYSLTRRTTINFLQRVRNRAEDRGNEALDWQVDPAESEADSLPRRDLLRHVLHLIDSELDRLPREVLYLHYFSGMSLSAINQHLGLTNKSGAKAYLVSGQRSLRKLLERERKELAQ